MAGNVLEKYVNEGITYTVDMSGVATLASGDTIASVSSVTPNPSGLTVSNISTDNVSKVQFKASGGTSGTTYDITVTVATAGGDSIEGHVSLYVR